MVDSKRAENNSNPILDTLKTEQQSADEYNDEKKNEKYSHSAPLLKGSSKYRKTSKNNNNYDDDDNNIKDDFIAPPGDEKRGMKLFKRHCAQCHSIYPDNRQKISGYTSWGPTMWNVYFRTAGIEKGGSTFQISKDMSEAGIVWNDANLMRYMRNPLRFTEARIGMNFFGMSNFQDRVDIIHYLKSLTYDHPRGKKILAELERTGAPVT